MQNVRLIQGLNSEVVLRKDDGILVSILLHSFRTLSKDTDAVFKERKIYENAYLSPLLFEEYRNICNLKSLEVEGIDDRMYISYMKHHCRTESNYLYH
jgi:hypothetical protein